MLAIQMKTKVNFAEQPAKTQLLRGKTSGAAKPKKQQGKELPDSDDSDYVTEYDKIADLDDLEITPWQRQMRVNKFMLEVAIRKKISQMLEPVYFSQQSLEEKLVNIVDKNISSINKRVCSLEDDIYHRETRDDRITRLQQKISDCELSVKLHNENGSQELKIVHDKLVQLESTELEMSKRFNIQESSVSDIKKFVSGYDTKIKSMITNIKTELQTFMKSQIDNSKSLDKKLVQHAIQLKNIELTLESSKDLTSSMLVRLQGIDASVADLFEKCSQLATGKTDLQTFQDFSLHMKREVKKTTELNDICINDVKTCSNYMEKYMPLYLQRQVSDFLEYIFIDRQTRWRINWYNEVKIPMLTAAILFDNGQEQLQERIEALHSVIQRGTIPPLPDEETPRTSEEEFMQISLKNKQVHAKAKLIIMQVLNQIQNPEKKISTSKVKIIDYSKATVTQIFQELLSIIKAEFPNLVDSMNIDGLDKDNAMREDQKMMEEELENDNSMEAQVEREVKKVVLETERQINSTVLKKSDEIVDMMKRMQSKGMSEMKVQTDQISEYIQEVHQFQIMEMQNFKDCHTQYLTSAKQIDRKLHAVVGIENANIQMLTQIKNLNEIVAELSQANLACFGDLQVMRPSSNCHNQDVIVGCQSTAQDSVRSDKQSRQAIQQSFSRTAHHQSEQQAAIPVSDYISGLEQANSAIKLEKHTHKACVVVPGVPGNRPQTQMQNRRSSMQLTTGGQRLNSRRQGNDSSNRQLLKSTQQLPCQNFDISAIIASAVPQDSRNTIKRGGSSHEGQPIRNTFSKLRQQSIKNMNQLQQIILDETNQLDKSNKFQKKNSSNSRMLSKDEFHTQVHQFKQRLSDTSAPDKYDLNKTTEHLRQQAKKNYSSTQQLKAATETKGVYVEVGEKKKQLGVRRTDDDLGSMLFGGTQNNDQLFHEPMTRDGKIEIFNKAAGLEHQAGRQSEQLIFDKKAVLQSMK